MRARGSQTKSFITKPAEHTDPIARQSSSEIFPLARRARLSRSTNLALDNNQLTAQCCARRRSCAPGQPRDDHPLAGSDLTRIDRIGLQIPGAWFRCDTLPGI